MGEKIYAFVFAILLTFVFIWDSNRQARFASFRQDGDNVYQSVASAEFGRTDTYTPECGTGTSVSVGLLAPSDGGSTPSLFFPNENSSSGIISYQSWFATVDPTLCLSSLKTLTGAYDKLSFTENGVFLGSGTGSIFFGSTYVDASGTIR